MKIFQVTYKGMGGFKRYAYFMGDYKNSRFYERWEDCNEQNKKHLDQIEEKKISEALKNYYKNEQ